MNILLGIISIIFCFSTIVLMEKAFKKEGLFVWISIATILANITVCKTVNLLGFASSLGNVLFASNFLATDILVEKYGKKEGKKAVLLGFISAVIYIIISQITLLYIPDVEDLAHESMVTLFSLSFRTTIASLGMYLIANLVDIWIFDKLKEKFPDKLWLRNNVATIVSNCAENFLFNFLAFVGLLPFNTILSIAIICTVIEIIIAICDTPFIYLAKSDKFDKLFKKEHVN